MFNLSITILAICAIGVCALLIWYSSFRKTDKEKKYEKHLEDSLDDEYIIDPETGAKITLEQAESGHWVSHDHIDRLKSEAEIAQLFSDEERQVEHAINHIKSSPNFTAKVLTEAELHYVTNTNMMGKYQSWSYSNPYNFKNDKGYLILPAPITRGVGYYDEALEESQILFVLYLPNIEGHYYFRKKSKVEKLLDAVKSDDELDLENYECFTIKSSNNIIAITRILERLRGEQDLEFELIDNKLFIKTLRLACIEDLERLENIAFRMLS